MLIFVYIYYSQKYPDSAKKTLRHAAQRLQNTVNKYSLIYFYKSTYCTRVYEAHIIKSKKAMTTRYLQGFKKTIFGIFLSAPVRKMTVCEIGRNFLRTTVPFSAS